MTGEELLEQLELADPAYVQAAAEIPAKRRRPRLRRAILAAACVCLLAGTVAAASGGGTWLLDSFTALRGPDFSESGYDLAADVEKFPESALTGEIQGVGAQIVHQYETYHETYLLSSRLPGSWHMKFSSAAEARDYIGLEGLRGLDWDLEEQQTELRVTGNAQGQLLLVDLETDYTVEGVRLAAFTRICLDSDEDPLTVRVRTTEYVKFSESSYTTANKKQCQVITDTGLASGYHGMDGYLVDSGVLYSLHLAYLKEDEALAESLLHRWADLF